MNNKLDLIIEKNCPVCRRTIKNLKVYMAERNDIELKVSDISKNEFENISIVPALLIDGKLFGYGDIDFKRLNKRLDY